MTKQQKTEQAEAIATLLTIIKPGDTVYTVLRHVSRTGMSRTIACYVIQDGQPRWITSLVSRALGYGKLRNVGRTGEGIHVPGCGMDMGFHLVHSLSYKLWGYGPEVKDAGYQLRHEWQIGRAHV